MRSSLEIYDLESQSIKVILESDTVIEAPNWSPDGSYLLINSGGRLYKVSLRASETGSTSGAEMQLVDTGPAVRCNNDHGISPDGQTIVISSHHGGKGSEIYLIPVGGGVPEMVSPDYPSWWHGWSPDGTTLAYVAARKGCDVIDVYTLALDGSPEVRLTFGEGHCDGPDFSADGGHIYYNCDRSGHAQIWVMNADGSHQTQLFSDAYVNWFPHPSPCGKHLIYIAYPEKTLGHPPDLPVAIVLCDPQGQNRRRIIELLGGQGTMNVPNWSPNGKAFAYVRFHAEPNAN
jgi:Tol biopolymer transport system component